MPSKAPSKCAEPGCYVLTREGRCDVHKRTPIDQRRGSAHARGYGARWRRLREMVLLRDVVCGICRRELSTEVDHIKPKAHGGHDALDNLQGLCKSCHSRKTMAERWGGGA